MPCSLPSVYKIFNTYSTKKFIQELSSQRKIRFLVSIMFFFIYFISNFNNLSSYSDNDYPFEADMGSYYRIFSDGFSKI